MPGDPSSLSKADLFARLAEGLAGGVTVVTPNRRLAQVLRAEFDSFQAHKGVSCWEDADILPLEAFAARCYDDATYAGAAGGELPLLLSSAQARALWEEAIRASRWHGALLDVPATAGRAMESWALAQAWRIAGALEKFPGGEDTQAFAAWARTYAQRCRKEGFTDAAVLPDLKIEGRKSRLLVAYAFDILPPQTRDYFKGFELLYCQPGKKQGKVVKTSFASSREELDSAARWARARLEEGRQHIGVVVPDLKLRRREAARVFGRVLGSSLPFELSIGEPLDSYALVDFALSLLEFKYGEIRFEQASRLIRSPFLGGAEGERAARARLDARLRREAGAEISLPRLIGLVAGCPLLRGHLEKFYGLKAGKQSPHDWAEHFTALLDAAGFPGERSRDSNEHQTLAKFNEVLGDFARLSVLSLSFSPQQALRQLRRLCAETLFQPEGSRAPIQVLGLIESVGIEFDALWVSGLTDGAWPQRVHPDPFLPAALQRKTGIASASAEASLALDRQRTEGWMRASDEVVFSWPRREEDRELSPSPLIALLPEERLELPAFPVYRDLLFSSSALESIADEKAPALHSKTIKGGTRVLADQAACPFRAFARHRLGAEALDAPEPGLDAMQRGQLLHALMAGIWSELKTSSGLSRDLNALIEKSAGAAVAELDLDARFAELEKRRLMRLAAEWLAVERGRSPFEVVQVEQKRPIDIGGLSFSGRIDRMDRFLEGEMRGMHVIIDYKTGRASRSSWMGDRPDEPQLPLYVISAAEDVTAVAFGTLRAGEMKFSGYGLKGKEIPGVEAAKNWPGLVATWKRDLDRLASGFAAGDARVDPKKGLATCRNCDLQPLCRVHERLSALAAEDDAGERE